MNESTRSNSDYVFSWPTDVFEPVGIPQLLRVQNMGLDISKLFHRFIRFYKFVNRKECNFECDSDNTEATVNRINGGDCGTAAIAVGTVLEKLGYEVTYWDNDAHGYIEVNGVFYDTMTPDGRVNHDEMFMAGDSPNPRVSGDKEWMKNQFHRADPLGLEWADMFYKIVFQELRDDPLSYIVCSKEE